MYWFLIAILLGVIIWAIFNFFGFRQSKVGKLKQKYYSISGLPEKVAYRSLNSQIEKLKKKYPHKDMVWYLEKIIFDLEKDKY